MCFRVSQSPRRYSPRSGGVPCRPLGILGGGGGAHTPEARTAAKESTAARVRRRYRFKLLRTGSGRPQDGAPVVRHDSPEQEVPLRGG